VSEAFGLRHFKAITATIKKQLWLSGSGHIISADYEKDVVADAVIAWFGDALARNSRKG
jgi:esterase/lipase